ncbi:MAG: acetyl-CoA C-acyltransferase [Planctomycetes bacterium]|nr:acetyl-CoA C-acyltransferase [Planctomycetota bacterium]
MERAVIVDAVRTGIGRAHKDRGYFRDVRGDDLAVASVRALVERTGIDPAAIEDLILGNTQQTLEHGLNAARTVGLMAGAAITTGGATVNRLCGSSLQALHQAVHAIMAGAEDIQIAGGFEHMHHVPMDHGLDLNPRLFHRTSKAALHMGATAEFLAQSLGITRREQDEFALRSHQRASQAREMGAFAKEIVGVQGRDEEGNLFCVRHDQCIRDDATIDALAALEPAFLPGIGSVTAGNSSPLNDGAAAMLVMSDSRARELGLRPLVRVRATAVSGIAPATMGLGPVPATEKALRRAGMTLKDVGRIELNEAFAVQVLACLRELKADPEQVNVRGGSIALGHPLGASGARIMTTLIHTMIDQDVEVGLATMCIGLGQGIATIVERV